MVFFRNAVTKYGYKPGDCYWREKEENRRAQAAINESPVKNSRDDSLVAGTGALVSPLEG